MFSKEWVVSLYARAASNKWTAITLSFLVGVAVSILIYQNPYFATANDVIEMALRKQIDTAGETISEMRNKGDKLQREIDRLNAEKEKEATQTEDWFEKMGQPVRFLTYFANTAVTTPYGGIRFDYTSAGPYGNLRSAQVRKILSIFFRTPEQVASIAATFQPLIIANMSQDDRRDLIDAEPILRAKFTGLPNMVWAYLEVPIFCTLTQEESRNTCDESLTTQIASSIRSMAGLAADAKLSGGIVKAAFFLERRFHQGGPEYAAAWQKAALSVLTAIKPPTEVAAIKP